MVGEFLEANQRVLSVTSKILKLIEEVQIPHPIYNIEQSLQDTFFKNDYYDFSRDLNNTCHTPA